MRDRRWCLGSADPAALDRPAKQQAIDHGAVGRAPFGTAGGHGGVGPGRRRRRRVRAALGRRPDRQTVTGRPEPGPGTEVVGGSGRVRRAWLARVRHGVRARITRRGPDGGHHQHAVCRDRRDGPPALRPLLARDPAVQRAAPAGHARRTWAEPVCRRGNYRWSSRRPNRPRPDQGRHDTSSSTQSSVRSTAFFQFRYSRSRSCAPGPGCQRWPSTQLSITSCSPLQ